MGVESIVDIEEIIVVGGHLKREVKRKGREGERGKVWRERGKVWRERGEVEREGR